MAAIRSILFNIVFFGWSATILLFSWILLPLPPAAFRRVIASWPAVVFPALRLLTGIRFDIRGLENIPGKPVLFASKHQSAWDTMLFLHLNAHTAYIMKAELEKIPFWGWYMRRCKHVAVDRSGGTKAMRSMIGGTREILDEGRSVVIFPEGTRTAPGAEGAYHPGVAALYSKAEATVVPVALNSGLFWARRDFVKRPGTILVQFLPPIEPGLSRDEFMTRLRTDIETTTRRLEAESGQRALGPSAGATAADTPVEN